MTVGAEENLLCFDCGRPFEFGEGRYNLSRGPVCPDCNSSSAYSQHGQGKMRDEQSNGFERIRDEGRNAAFGTPVFKNS